MSTQRQLFSGEIRGEGVNAVKNSGIVNIHGRDYMTVAKRVELAHDDAALEGIETEILSHEPIVVRARVKLNGKTFTGISAVIRDNARTIEKENPYEVAETSAVGRALGFAGYGLTESVASADEVVRAATGVKGGKAAGSANGEQIVTECVVCGKKAVEKRGKTKAGKEYHGIFCSTGDRTHTQWLNV